MPEQAAAVSKYWAYAAIAVASLVAIQLVRNAVAPTGIDFISYWAAARLTLAGTPALAYDIAIHHAVESQVASIDGLMSFPYPPPFLAIVFPFGLLPFSIAAIAWGVMSLGILAVAARRWLPGVWPMALAFPPILVCGIIGQNGLLTAAVMIAALNLLERRPLTAGLLFAVLAIKPQLAAAVPLFLLAMRNWRALAGALIGGVVLGAGSLAMFGLGAWHGFLGILPFYGQIAAHGGVAWNRVGSAYGAMRGMGLTELPAAAIHGAIAMAGLMLLWRVARGASRADLRNAVLVTVTLLLSPYGYMYDQVMLVAALPWLMRRWGERAVMHVMLLSLLGFVVMLADLPALNLIPAAPLALLALLYRDAGSWPAIKPRKLVPAAGIEPAAP